MTNAEKYQEVFGMKPDTGNCPTSNCNFCPCASIDDEGCISCIGISVSDFWNSEYKENEDGK